MINNEYVCPSLNCYRIVQNTVHLQLIICTEICSCHVSGMRPTESSVSTLKACFHLRQIQYAISFI